MEENNQQENPRPQEEEQQDGHMAYTYGGAENTYQQDPDPAQEQQGAAYTYGQPNPENRYGQQGDPYGAGNPYGYGYGNGSDPGYQNIYQNANNGYGQYAKMEPQPGIGFGIASIILGILSLVMFCTCINIPIGIAAIVVGIIHLCRKAGSNWLAVTGIVTGALSIVAFILLVLLMWRPALSFYQNSNIRGYDYDDDYDYDGNYDYDDDHERGFTYDFDIPFPDGSQYDYDGHL